MNKNVPNILTMSRIACTPLIVLFFLLPIPYGIGIYIAFAIYVLGCLTDMVDGHIARKYNLISDFGKFMDQIADKFITTTAMILVMFANVTYGWLSIIMLLIVVLRDILIGGIRMVAANKNVVIAADIFGKVKSLFLDTANSFLLFYIAISCNLSGYFFIDVIKYSGLSLMIIGVLLSVLSCYNYSKNALKALNGKSVPSNISN
ncbi:MAG: CDP-diacylglycerol--glycerol-3-phosphate 3-phosphatidyltransferase, partial [Bacilli bacterium]|nr:CDP-diacylglycerol--glycerol-3-phosphate 3-phosphatidyltransferase [Bacilli bacterium]